MRNKKGELTTQQIVLLIILITSFVVILFFLFRLDLGKESKSEVCHNSVLMGGNSVFPEGVELKCHTEYVCITNDGTCEELNKPRKFEVDSADEVYNVLAEEMAKCWWMFGEGKVDYVGKKLTKGNYCSICSQIYFDDSLINLDGFDEGKISKDELYNYISSNEYSEGETYSEYIFKTNNLESLKEDFSDPEGNLENINTFGSINIGDQYYVLMGITSEVSVSKWVALGAGTASTAKTGTFILSSVFQASKSIPLLGNIISSVLVVGSIAGGTVATLIEPEIGGIIIPGDGISNQFLAPTIQEIKSDNFDALNCQEIITYA